MKKSLLLGLGAVAMAIGAVASSLFLKRDVAYETNAETVNYWLVGDGSFVSGSTWSTAGGVQLMEAASGQKGRYVGVYLEAGDVFKVTNGTSEWYGFDKLDTISGVGGTNFRTAYFDYYNCGTWENYNSGNGDTTADGKHTYYVNDNSNWYWQIHKWNGSTETTWSGPEESGTQISDKLYSFENGRYITEEVTAVNVIFHNKSECQTADLSYESNGNIVVGTTAYYSIYLKNDGAILINSFTESSGLIELKDYIDAKAAEDYRGFPEGSRTATCAEKYDTATEMLGALAEDQQIAFQENPAYQSYRDILDEWEAAKIKQLSSVKMVVDQKGVDPNSALIVSISAVGLMGSAAFVFFAKYRKER